MKNNFDVYKPRWSWGKNVDRELKKRIKNLYTLNFPCGNSPIGDVRADIDPQHKPDIICSLTHPPFRPGSFECLISDPPFSMFSSFRWLLRLKDLTTKYFILSTPKICPSFRGFTRDVRWTSANDKLFLRPWIEYKKKDLNLEEFF